MFGLLCWANFLLIHHVLWENLQGKLLYLDVFHTLDTATLDLESSLFFSGSKGTWKIIHRDMEQEGNGNKINYNCAQFLCRSATSGVLNWNVQNSLICLYNWYWIVWGWTYIKLNPMIFSYFAMHFYSCSKTEGTRRLPWAENQSASATILLRKDIVL